MITAYLVGDTICSTSSDAFSWYEKSRWGEKKKSKIGYSSVEVLFLVEQNKMVVFSGKKELSWEELLKKFKKKDKRIETKFTVFADLRKKGHVVKAALKFGAEFRVYDKGFRPGEEHARWIVYCVRENEQMNWHDFAAKNRVAHSTKKNLLLAIVDEEGDVTYYEVEWKKV